MRLTITIDMDNAAFEPCPLREAARILRDAADHADHGPSQFDDWTPRDINGNRVGSVTVTG